MLLLFTSLTPFRMMSLIGEMIPSESRFSNVTFLCPMGGFGAATMMQSKARFAHGAVVIGIIRVAFLFLTVYWGQASVLPFAE